MAKKEFGCDALRNNPAHKVGGWLINLYIPIKNDLYCFVLIG